MLAPGTVQADDGWQFAARLEGWFPDVSGETAFSGPTGEDDFEIDVDDYLSSVEFGFMGSFEASKGKWGISTDLIYASMGDDGSQDLESSIGRVQQRSVERKLSADLDVDSWIWNTVGFYRLLDSEGMTLDLLAGVRYVDVQQELDWRVSTSIDGRPLPERSGKDKVEVDNWDAVIGVRGRIPFSEGGRWFLPFYLDVGTGDSDFTWQGAAGLGYAFSSSGLALVWRHLEYDLDSGSVVSDLKMSGPAMVYEYAW
jgi:hypothetical protein